MLSFTILSFIAGFGLSQASSFTNCAPSTFSSVLPENATLVYAVPYEKNSTFDGTITTGPAFCALYLNVTSSESSSYEFGLWLPTETWNDRFIAYGNGGFMSQAAFDDMSTDLDYGFATVSTNTGHNSSFTEEDGAWALKAPEKRTDWGWRALHGSVVLGKTLTEAFYDSSIEYSYYAGCSTGGRQGLKSLQMFPDDFDGVLAGAPAWWTTHLQQWNLKVATYNLPNDASHHIPENLISTIAAEVIRQCDDVDGLKDGIITNPYACNFRPEALLCGSSSTNASTCLSSDQISTLYKLHNDWVDVNQTFVFPALTYSSEAQWNMAIISEEANPGGIAYARYFLYDDPSWPWENLDYSTIELAEDLDPGDATADDFDLRPFKERGGKLIHYHGLADGSISTGSSIYFYNQVLRLLQPKGIDLSEFYRFFLIPGMQHCSGGVNDAPWYISGANQARSLATSPAASEQDPTHNALLALMAWVEDGIAPEQLVATKYTNDDPSQGVTMQRPICPYPQEAKYVDGDQNKPTSFDCVEI